MRVHKLAKNRNFRDLDLPVLLVSGLLAAPSTPDEIDDDAHVRIVARMPPSRHSGARWAGLDGWPATIGIATQDGRQRGSV
jgi:hypothetical protein